MNKKFNFLVQVSLALGICLSLLGGVSTPVEAQSALDGFNPNANNTVQTIAVQEDGRILVGGSFTQISGVEQKRIARLNPDGGLDTSFTPTVNEYEVLTLAVQPDGKILVGGSFTEVNGVGRNHIARLNPDGSLDELFDPIISLDVEPLCSVNALALQDDGKILIGGVFDEVNGVTRNRIARLNSDGSLDQTFDPNVTYGSGDLDLIETPSDLSVKALVLQTDGKILIGGAFTQVSGQTRKYIARLNANGSLDTGFNPDVQGLVPEYPADYAVRALAVQANGMITLGGKFDLVNGTLNKNLARLNPDGSLDTSFNPAVNNEVRAIVIQPDGNILIGGNFSVVESITRNYIARLKLDGSLDADFNPNADSVVVTLAQQSDGKILAGGIFTHISTVERNRIARLYPDGSLDADLNPGADDLVQTIALQPDGKVLIGGYFTQVGGQPRNRIARLHADGSLDLSFDPDANDRVYALAVQQDGKILIGGAFTQIGGVSRNRIARLNANGSLDDSFNPNLDSHVNSIVVQKDGKILIGGAFTTIGTETRNYIARLDANGNLDADFNPDANHIVRALALQPDGKMLVGGVFTQIGDVTRNHIAKLGANGSLDDSFNPDANAAVMAITLQSDGKILVGGDFNQINGVTHNHIARLNANGTLDTTFNTDVADGAVKTFAVQADGKILIGGAFTTIETDTRNYIARLHASGSLDASFDPNASEQVLALALQQDGKVLMGGQFTLVGGLSRSKLARLSNNTPALQTFSVDALGKAITWHIGGASPEVGPVTFESSTNGTDYIPLGHATRSPEGWRMFGLKLPKQQDLWIRARGFYGTGCFNGSGAVLESVFYVFAPPAIHYAKPQATGTSDCLSWDNACNLQDALAMSASGDEVWVAEGVHYPGSTRTDWFNVTYGVNVLGGFAGTETTRDERDWQANLTILSGDIGQDDINTDGNFIAESTDEIVGENAYHVVFVSHGFNDPARLDGFIITAGMANHQQFFESCGGGMLLYRSSPSLTNLIFSGNLGKLGGGICTNVSNPKLTNVTFKENKATNGGGMFNSLSNPNLTNVSFNNNSADGGGGMFNYDHSNPILTNVSFNNNSAANAGGMYNQLDSRPILTNVTFSGNSATKYGGALINIQDSNPILTNVIMWGNSATNNPEIYNDDVSIPNIAFSDIQDCGGSSAWNPACGEDGGGNIDADHRFIDAEHGNLRLGPNSPAIDAGDNSAVPDGILTDLDGNPRFVDIATIPDTGFGDPPFVDMGAFEAQSFDLAPAITSANNTTFMVGVSGTFIVTTSGYPTPTLSKTGDLPSGVTFTNIGDGSASLAGSPAAGTAGEYVIEITASNGVLPDATQTFTLKILQPGESFSIFLPLILR